MSPTYLVVAFDGYLSTRGQQQVYNLEMTMLASNVQKSAILQQTVMRFQQHIRLQGRTSGMLLCLLTYTDEAVRQNSSTHAILLFWLQQVGDNLFRYFIYTCFESPVEQLSHQCDITLLCDRENVLQVDLVYGEYMWPMKPIVSGTG